MTLQQDLFPRDDAEIEKSGGKGDLVHRSGTFIDNMKLPVHRWFRYSAGFSAAWAEDEIRKRGPDCKVVLDPFAGSGTTLIAAEAAGVAGWGYESHPFVSRIALAKLSWRGSERVLADHAAAVLAMAKTYTHSDIAGGVPALLTKCFDGETLRALDALRVAYIDLNREDEPEWRLIWLAITSILRPCSFVGTAQWQYVLPNKRKAKVAQPFDAFSDAITRMRGDMREVKSWGTSPRASVRCEDARDALNTLPKEVDLVITSPPYPNNFDYADATRLEMTFWREIEGWSDLKSAVRPGLVRSCSQHTAAEKLELEPLLADPSVEAIRSDLSRVCNALEAIRHTKGGKKTYHTMVAAYFRDLSLVWRGLRSACKSGSEACFVIGDSAPYGIHVPAEQWLGELALSAGFKSWTFEKLRERNTKWKNRKHRVPLLEGRLWVKG